MLIITIKAGSNIRRAGLGDSGSTLSHAHSKGYNHDVYRVAVAGQGKVEIFKKIFIFLSITVKVIKIVLLVTFKEKSITKEGSSINT